VIHEGWLAKVWQCDEIARSQMTIRQSFLDRVKCATLDQFTDFLPKPGGHAWLVFDAVNRLDPETRSFLRDLIQLSYASHKFSVLVFTHHTNVACDILAMSESLRPIQIVEPLGCCRSRGAACPDITDIQINNELEARWTLGLNRLHRFIRDEWAQSGAFTLGGSGISASHACATGVLKN
jgi:hypothetical protein